MSGINGELLQEIMHLGDETRTLVAISRDQATKGITLGPLDENEALKVIEVATLRLMLKELSEIKRELH